jgi:hypothetical protein
VKEVFGWILFGIGVVLFLVGLKVAMDDFGGRPAGGSFLGSLGRGGAIMALGIALGTIGLQMAGQLPEEVKDPFTP